ncbi:hypothetical protein SARC_09035 [Sphaeroforma arctica JP610]|uniref:G-protein coupled receptors family 3 profile domain-containing protein n=1 Tax=Sphaeroforma arctica JP610 TaxID=667725 RepID=A0A0L0FPV2_9EUKA|nr:hypothetical protein SARC_09035 [Sphaeroforma arctica JP610]KNC78541.1 hypothetical protein SARC_09035 [Sphaeroforma arctica JP610]|eukprot:XP_014152443.1 hypothetical protein SARC_09035 [Sphaeroforma arctica JP610]
MRGGTDCIVIATSSTGNSTRTMEIIHDLRLGADSMLWLFGLPSGNVPRQLYPGMIVPVAFEDDFESDIDPKAEFLGNISYLQQLSGDYFEPRFGLRVQISLSVSTMNAIQTLQLAMVRANCDTSGAGLTECIRNGINTPCSSISGASLPTCDSLGASELDVNTWFGRVKYSDNHLRSTSFYARVNEQNNPDASTPQTVSQMSYDIEKTGFPVRVPIHPDATLRIIVGVLCGLGVIGCLVGIIGVQIKSSVLIVRSAAPFFLQLMLAGSALMYASPFFLIFDNLEEWECTAWSWFLFMGWSVAFVSLLVKTHRVDQVFKSVTKTKLHDHRLLRNWFLPMVGVFVLFAILFTVFDTLQLVIRTEEQSLWEECDLETPGMYVGLGLQGIVLVWAAILAFKVRNAPSSFNEATLISVSVYNWLVVEIVAIVLLFILPSSVNTQLIMLFLYTWLPLTIMLLMMFVPKIQAIRKGKGDVVSTMNSSRAPIRAASAAAAVSNASMSDKTVSGTQAHNEVRKLRAEVGRLVNENTRLSEVLTMIHNPHMEGGEAMADKIMQERKQKSMATVSIHDPPPVLLPQASARIQAPTNMDDIANKDDDDMDEGAESIDALSV